jgi:negative modulator of initiation of replication
MRQVSVAIDEKTFDALNVLERFTGRDKAQITGQIVREFFLNLGSKEGPERKVPPVEQSLHKKDAELIAFVDRPAYLASRSVVEMFLDVLSFIHKQDPAAFKALDALAGRSRKYFAQSSDVLESSGVSVNPKKIPNTNFWVVTNNSTATKKTLLAQALDSLGYQSSTTRKVVDTLR